MESIDNHLNVKLLFLALFLAGGPLNEQVFRQIITVLVGFVVRGVVGVRVRVTTEVVIVVADLAVALILGNVRVDGAAEILLAAGP